MFSLGDMRVVYSGGAANTSQQNSYGGAISTAPGGQIVSQSASFPTASISGVTLIDARGHAVYSEGTLSFNHVTKLLSWKRPGGVTFVGQYAETDGRYTVGDADGYLIVDVVASQLPASTLAVAVAITPTPNNLFDNISPAQSLAGYVDYRCFYMKNTAVTGNALDVRVWVKKQPDGADTLAIALDPSGLNGTALAPVDETDSTTVLSGLSWSAPASQSTGLVLGNLTPGQYRAFWVRRTVPAETYTQVLNNRSALSFSALM